MNRQYVKVTMADGQVYSAAIDERDIRRWELTFKSKGWPHKDEAEFLFQGFIAAAAMKREGILDQPVEAIMTDIASIEKESEEPVDPTDAVPGDG